MTVVFLKSVPTLSPKTLALLLGSPLGLRASLHLSAALGNSCYEILGGLLLLCPKILTQWVCLTEKSRFWAGFVFLPHKPGRLRSLGQCCVWGRLRMVCWALLEPVFCPAQIHTFLKVLGVEEELLFMACLCFWWLIVLHTLDNFFNEGGEKKKGKWQFLPLL